MTSEMSQSERRFSQSCQVRLNARVPPSTPMPSSSAPIARTRDRPRASPASVRITPASSHIASISAVRRAWTLPGLRAKGWLARPISASSTASSGSRRAAPRASAPITSPAMPP